MNFYGHAHVACWFRAEPPFVLGAMLPDLASMVGARPPRTSNEALSSGIACHHATDEAFHACPTFRRLNQQAARDLAAHGLRRGSALASAHVGVEILLDCALDGFEATRRAYLDALRAAVPGDLGQLIEWSEPDARERFERLRQSLESRGSSVTVAEPARIARRLERALAGRPRLELDDTAVATLEGWSSRWRLTVAKASHELLEELRARLAPRALDATPPNRAS